MKRQRVRVSVLVCASLLTVSLPASATPLWVTGDGGATWWGEVQRVVLAWWEDVKTSEGTDEKRESSKLETDGGDVLLLGTQDGETCRPWVTEQSCSIDPDG